LISSMFTGGFRRFGAVNPEADSHTGGTGPRASKS
jgi:hypothetical protein